jgi:hypothetical protein
MSDPTNPTVILPAGQPGLTVAGNKRAPFIYLDGCAAYGTQAGAIQIEVAARTILPTPDGGTRNEFVVTGHLRCSQAAAMELRTAIDKALATLAELAQQQSQEPKGGRLN